MSRKLPPAAFLDDPVALAPLRKADDPRLERLAGGKEVRVLRETMELLSQEAGHDNRLLEAYHVLVLHLLVREKELARQRYARKKALKKLP